MDLRNLRFGIEIETIKRTRETVAKAIQTVVGGQARPAMGAWQVLDDQGRTWKVVSDGSLINVPENLRAEVVSPILTYADIEKLQNVVRAIRERGAKVDERCGIHIHVDAASFDGRTLSNLAKLVYKQEALILHALNVSQSRQERYTRPISNDFIRQIEEQRPRTTTQLNRIWYGRENRQPTHYDHTRYHGVNFHNVWYRGTVEFRWFEGTLHAGKIKGYIQLVLAIAAKALKARAACSSKRTFNAQSARYDFRVFLLRLGLIGDEFKTARKHLMGNLPGDAAFKRGRPQPAPAAPVEAPAVSQNTTNEGGA